VETIGRIRNVTFKSQPDAIKQELERVGRQTAKVLTAAEEAAQSLRTEAEQEARKITQDAQASVASIKTSADQHAKKVRQEAEAFATKTRADAEGHSTRLRSEAEKFSARGRQEAEVQATKLRDEADGYAKRVRGDADAHASKTAKAAQAKAAEILEKATVRRREIETVVADLEHRRDAVVGGLERLSNQLAGAATEGRSPSDSLANGSPAATGGNSPRPLNSPPARPPARSHAPPSE
jgi:hypothetical protein